jgi:hypothetical protein
VPQNPELGQIDIVEVIHADGSTGQAKLLVVGVARPTVDTNPDGPQQQQ